jgi:hypothetical protein
LDGSNETLYLTGSNPNINAVLYDSTTGRFVLYSKPAATVADMQAAIANVRYKDAAASPTPGARTVSIVASDASNSNTAIATLTLTSNAVANSAPALDASKSPALTGESQANTTAPIGAVGTLVSQLVSVTGIANYSDADGNPAGIALVGTDTSTATGGAWYYTTDGGTTWSSVGSVTTANALLLKTDSNTRLYFMTNSSYAGTMSSAITFRAWDQTAGSAGSKVDTSTNGGTTSFSTATDTASLIISATNHAPALDASKSPALTAQSKTDTAVPSGAVGTLVSQLIDRGGALSNFTDSEASDPVGIALTNVDISTATGSSWYYTTDGGGSWSPVGTISNSSALLLKADASTRLFFVNNGTYTGTMASAITFRAWDQSSGTAASRVDTSTNGSTTAFSTTTDTASLVVNQVNTAPTFSGAGSATTTLTVTAGSSNNALTSLLTVSDTDSGQVETWHQLTGASHGTLSLNAADLTVASGSASLSPAAGIKYTPNAGYAGTDSFTVTVSDGQATITKTITVTVTPVAPGTPTLASDTGVTGDNKTNATSISFSGTGAAYGTGATDGSDVIVFLDVNNNGSYDAGTDRQATVTANTSGVWTGAAVDATGVADGSYNVYAQTRSTIGAVTSVLSTARAITIDRTAPTLSSTSPADNSASVSSGTTTLGLTFDSTVRAGTGNFVLHDITTNTDVATIAAGSGSITGWGTTGLTITHGATLASGHHYSLHVAWTAVQDDAGNTYAGITNDVSFDFTVANTAPTFANVTNTLTVAQNAGATDISSYLVASDSDTSRPRRGRCPPPPITAAP